MLHGHYKLGSYGVLDTNTRTGHSDTAKNARTLVSGIGHSMDTRVRIMDTRVHQSVGRVLNHGEPV